jgi:hypothetical protein
MVKLQERRTAEDPSILMDPDYTTPSIASIGYSSFVKEMTLA